MQTPKNQTVLIIGASGKFGHNAAEAFEKDGWSVRRFNRLKDELEVVARDVDVIVMAGNPKSYKDWDAELLPMHEKAIQAAKACGATIILPGNVYIYGPDAPYGWNEATPHLAVNPLAKLRIQLEQMYLLSGVQTILIRAGDFIDTEKTQNWFDMFIAPKVEKGFITYPGDLNCTHSWAYLPDLARASVMLANKRATLATFEEVPFDGFTLTGKELAAAIAQALNHPVQARQMSWLKFQLARPFLPILQGVFEMRYLWDLPHKIDGAKFARLCPDFHATPVQIAMTCALQGAVSQRNNPGHLAKA